MNRRLIALPAAMLLTLGVAGTAFGTHCGNTSKPDGSGQHVVLLVDPVSGDFTPLAGMNANGGFTGAFADVYIDLDLSGDISSGDLLLNDTYLLSMHSGSASPGQDGGEGLAVLPAILHGNDPAGAARGAGFADVSFVP
ncbi:MAG: hypothetical protein ABI534_02130 [Chloroflexota bacterium]